MKHFKGDPSQYIIKYVSGKKKKARMGQNFYYLAYHTNIASIPAVTIDSYFIFNEITQNYQEITLQGHCTYRIIDPNKMANLLDFTIDLKTHQYRSKDPEKLDLRIKNVIQMLTRAEILKLSLEEALTVSQDLSQQVLEKTKDSELFREMGIKILSIAFISIRPTPEMSKALEADYRESVQRKADEAIYARRAAAVEQERKIKENELNTQISLEEKRQKLIDLKGENTLKDAEFNSKAKELELLPFKDLDPKLILALALKDLSINANKIGNLTITSEILSSLLNK